MLTQWQWTGVAELYVLRSVHSIIICQHVKTEMTTECKSTKTMSNLALVKSKKWL